MRTCKIAEIGRLSNLTNLKPEYTTLSSALSVAAGMFPSPNQGSSSWEVVGIRGAHGRGRYHTLSEATGRGDDRELGVVTVTLQQQRK